ncbi:MAG: hypothetical protein WBZ19_28510 [Chthoniobacterales bacterium]
MTDDRLRMAAVAPAPGGEPLLTIAKPATGPGQKSWRNQGLLAGGSRERLHA